jgi:hypothetical protein
VTPALHTDTLALPRVVAVVPARPAAGPRRVPVAAVVAGVVALVEAVALLAVGLSGFDALVTGPGAPPGSVVAVLMMALSGWVVLAAAGGAGLLDGAGRLLLVVVSAGELVLLGGVTLVGVLAPGDVPVTDLGPWRALPVPGLALLGALVPLGKLALSGTPAVQAWLAAGGRPRRPREAAAPLPPHARRARHVTVAAIGLALTAVALVAPAAPGAGSSPVGSEVTTP